LACSDVRHFGRDPFDRLEGGRRAQGQLDHPDPACQQGPRDRRRVRRVVDHHDRHDGGKIQYLHAHS